MGGTTFLGDLAIAVRGHRQEDPTAPVTVVVSTMGEVVELRTTLARHPDPAMHVGVAVTIPALCAGGGVVGATPEVLADAVRRHAAVGYFAALDGLAGVTDALTSAMLVWDAALPTQRATLRDAAPSDVDRTRLEAVADLHRSVIEACQAAGMVLPSGLLATGPELHEDALWIDATVTALDPIAAQWLRRLRDACGAAPRFLRLDPAAYPVTAVDEVLISAVDPFDECGLAARAVTTALEAGVPAREIAVAVPSSALGRYADLIGSDLDAARVPHDGSVAEPGRIGSTRGGAVVAAIGAAVADLRQPGDLRFDHLVSVIRAGGLPDATGAGITNAALRTLWEHLRGTDPASWPSAVAPIPAVPSGGHDAAGEADGVAEVLAATAATAGLVARFLDLARVARSEPTPWSEFASALGPLVPAALATSDADGAAHTRLHSLLTVWRHRDGTAQWSQAWEELASLIGHGLTGQDDGAGVRIVALSQGWAIAPTVAIAVGLCDDLVPGVQAAVGPLTADEVLALRAIDSAGSARVDDDDRSLAALRATAGRVTFSYPRSDQLRTIVREPSRFLPATEARQFGSVAAQFEAVDEGEAGLMGSRDAAASIVRSGGDPRLAEALVAVDLARATGNVAARREPPEAGEVDAFNGDLRGLSAAEKARLSPDSRRGHDDSASPSGLESLLGCPIGWWAQRIVRVDEPGQWDPPTLAQPDWGKWLHRALVLLSERGVLLAKGLNDDDVEQALWAAVGGVPAGALDLAAAESEVLGYRYRITAADVVRATREVQVIAGRLQEFLGNRDGPVGLPVHEAYLPRQALDLESGPLHLAGRVDRIDTLKGNRHLITDYKTGRAGSGFQLAVYGWLWLLTHGGTAELLYATTRDRKYEASVLVDDGPSVFTAAELEAFLRDTLTEPVRQARNGVFASMAWDKDRHDRYCPVCADVVVADGGWGSVARGVRAAALVAAAAPADEATEVAS